MRLRFDGEEEESYLLGRLLSQKPPLIEVVNAKGEVVAASYAALETPIELARSIDQIGRRIIALLIASLKGRAGPPLIDPRPATPPVKPTCSLVLSAGAGRLVSSARHKLGAGADPSWNVAIRPATIGLPQPGGEWTVQPTGFLADPCLHAHGAAVTLFGEALGADGRTGHIVCAPLSPEGELGELGVVLRAEHHLSYPFVFDHDGEVFMIPETGSVRRVELYRAVEYPFRWAPEAVLIEGPKLVDATPVRRDGLWWLFAGGAEYGDSAHDQLFLYYSEALTGPWCRHPISPLRSDCRGSRPAGGFLEVDGKLYRPAQNNEVRYGGGLTWFEVTELTPDGYSERPVAAWSGADFGAFDGVHTFSRAGGFEAIDLLRLRLASSPRGRSSRRR